MDVAQALAELPASYATALRLRDEHASHEEIARSVGVERESVRLLLTLADSKLRRLIDDEVEGS